MSWTGISKRFCAWCLSFIVILILGGITYTGQFPNAANDVLLVTGITCPNTATTLSECTFNHFTKTSYCDATSITAIKCQSK